MSNFTPSVTVTSITAGGTSQILMAAADADTPRQSVIIQPQTEACLINFGATAGVQATGALLVDSLPANNETIAINGTTFTFKSSAPSGNQFLIGANEAETAANMVSVLNASAVAGIAVATYAVSGDSVTITYDAGGTTGNSYTLADSSGGKVTRSAATLAGGSNTVGGLLLATNTLAEFDANKLPQIKLAIYVTSATTAAKISTIYGQA